MVDVRNARACNLKPQKHILFFIFTLFIILYRASWQAGVAARSDALAVARLLLLLLRKAQGNRNGGVLSAAIH